jgi:hypothetical protein
MNAKGANDGRDVLRSAGFDVTDAQECHAKLGLPLPRYPQDDGS